MIRVGIGYDIHKLKKGRKLYLGGIEIPFKKGLVGHSDADVVIHALIESLLGAMSYSNIGELFPDTDQSFKDIRSTLLLQKVKEILKQKKCKINNIDIVIIIEKPLIGKFIPLMKKELGNILEINSSCINIKPRRKEGMDSAGKGKAIEAYAVSCIEMPDI